VILTSDMNFVAPSKKSTKEAHGQTRISRTPYPQIGQDPCCHRAPKFSPSPPSPQRKLRPPNWNMNH